MRIAKLKKAAEKQNLPPNFAIFKQTNINYFTGFQGAAALLITEQGENVLFVSGVNYQQAKQEVNDFNVQLLQRGENLMKKIAQQTGTAKLTVDTLPIESWRVLSQAVGGEDKLEPANLLFRNIRRIKDEQEVKLIRIACKVADAGIKIAHEIIRPGLTVKDVAAEVEYAMRKAGSDGVAFETIVACGDCCAYPHGSNIGRSICDSDFVMVDLGATHQFYCSDITRTFVAGKPNQKQQIMYEIVRLAQQKAIEVIKPGINAKEVDAVARRVIGEAGFGDYFVHNLGHGVGLEVHEAPVLGPDSEDILEAGNVVTVEPGIYIPEYGGVRIEDTILVTSYGSEKLTTAPINI